MIVMDTAKVDAVSKKLLRLTELCDSGFALAIHIRYTRPSLLYRTYNQAWIDTYSERGFMLSDPVVHWGLSQTGWVAWRDLSGQDPEGVLASAVAHGLNNGWTYSVGPATSRTIAGLTKTGADFTVDQRAEAAVLVDDIHTLTDGFDASSAAIQEALRALG